MRNRLLTAIQDSIEAVGQLRNPSALAFIEDVSYLIADCFRRGNKLIIAGNGGSLSDAAHFAEELTGFFRQPRQALPAIALSEPGHLTCVANDIGYEWVFARGVEAYGKEEDVFVGLSTSGNSSSIIKAFEIAKAKGLKTVAFLGKKGGKLKGFANFELIIEGFSTSDRIQEAHMAAIHLVIEMVESILFSQTNSIAQVPALNFN